MSSKVFTWFSWGRTALPPSAAAARQPLSEIQYLPDLSHKVFSIKQTDNLSNIYHIYIYIIYIYLLVFIYDLFTFFYVYTFI